MSKPNKAKIEIPTLLGFLLEPKRYKISYGGRGGSKSWGFARVLIALSMGKKLRILCTRELQKSITDSVYKLLKDQIFELDLNDFFDISRKYFDIKHNTLVNAMGSEFIFCGLRTNISEIKSMEGIDICWVEEAQKVSEESWQILIPTIRKEDSEIWISFNPDSIDDPTYKRFVLNPPPDSITREVSYKDNPWFPETLRKEMEWDKQNDYEKYLHIWEGEPRTYTDAQIFKGKFRVDVFEDTDHPGYDGPYYGADWGFSNDPNSLIRDYIHNHTLYISHEAYGVGVELDETPEFFRSVPGADKYPIRADSARPDTISFMRKRGFNVIGAKKGPGSVEDGISFIRSFKEVVIHERCIHTLQEFKSYSYKIDRLTGDVLPIIVDAHNHSIDSIRYSLEPIMKNKSIKVSEISASDLGL